MIIFSYTKVNVLQLVIIFYNSKHYHRFLLNKIGYLDIIEISVSFKIAKENFVKISFE